MPFAQCRCPAGGCCGFRALDEETLWQPGPRVHRRHRRPETDHDSREPVGAPSLIRRLSVAPAQRGGLGVVLALRCLGPEPCLVPDGPWRACNASKTVQIEVYLRPGRRYRWLTR